MATVQLIKRRRYGIEEAWFPVLEELGHARLRQAFIQKGVSPQVAGNLVWFLEDQLTLERSLSKGTRNNYRATLGDIDPREIRRLAARSIPGWLKSEAA